MLWRIRSFLSRIRSRFFNVFSGRGSLYRVESLRKKSVSSKRDSEKPTSMSVDKGIRKYEKRQMAARGERQYNFFNLKNIIKLIAVIAIYIFYFCVHSYGRIFCEKSIYCNFYIYSINIVSSYSRKI